jgi:hypothetical protein
MVYFGEIGRHSLGKRDINITKVLVIIMELQWG